MLNVCAMACCSHWETIQKKTPINCRQLNSVGSGGWLVGYFLIN